MKIKYNEPLKYKDICEMMEDEKTDGSRNRQLQLNKWRKKYNIDKEEKFYYIRGIKSLPENIYMTPLTYDEICEIMEDEPVKNISTNRKNQLRKWQQYYDIEKYKTTYIIKRKYNENELDLIENSGKYTSYITDRLLEYLFESQQQVNTITYYEIYEMCCMVNEKYHKSKNNMYDIFKRNEEIGKFDLGANQDLKFELGVDNYDLIKGNLNLFFRVSNKLLKQNVDNALKSMKSNGLILYMESFVLHKKPIKQSDGTAVQFPSHKCTDYEDSVMLDLQKKAREYVGVKSPRELYFSAMEIQNEYYDFLLKSIKEEFGYDYYSNAVKIIQGKEAVAHELRYNKSLKINDNIQKQMIESKEMSQKIISYLCKQFVEEYIKR